MRPGSTTIFVLLVTFVAASVECRTASAWDVIVGQAIPATQRVSIDDIDHAAWTQLLQRYVDDDGYVDYRSWLKSATDVGKLDQYLRHLSSADLMRTASQNAKLAYWINAYNAVTIRGILREYPTSSIRNHTATLFGYNIWKDLLLIVGDRRVSLDAIEHEILRPMGEPRIHFAIVCASVGCPRLLSQAYTAASLDEQLTTNATKFFEDPAKFQVSSGTREIRMSPILDWFGEDFGSSQQAQLRTIAPYVPERHRELLVSGHATVRFLDYDWSLNDQARRNASPQ